jgi:hypothetical protein
MTLISPAELPLYLPGVGVDVCHSLGRSVGLWLCRGRVGAEWSHFKQLLNMSLMSAARSSGTRYLPQIHTTSVQEGS